MFSSRGRGNRGGEGETKNGERGTQNGEEGALRGERGNQNRGGGL